MRFAYWIGMRAGPSCTKTTETTIPIAISGKNSSRRRAVQPRIDACGIDVRIDAKIRIEMPLQHRAS